MAELRTEEEQVEAIKKWWKENGRSTLLGVLIALLAVFGWRAWQQHQQDSANAASALYQSLLGAVTVPAGQSLTEEQRKTAEHLAGQLKSEFSGSLYARYAALWLAKDAVEAQKLDQARTELEWVLAQNPDPATTQITKLRLARVMLAQGQGEQALARLEGGAVDGFQASYYEVQGDIYLALKRVDEARQAYEKAVAAADQSSRPILSMKLDDLAVAEAN